MRGMSERPEQRPEGTLIGRAQKRSRMSQREAATRAGISEARWRNIVSGYQTISAGQYAPIKGPADTVARMAQVVGVTAEELADAGEREDAAQELRALPPLEEPLAEPSVAELAAELAAERERRADLERRIADIERREQERIRAQTEGKTG